MQLEGVTERFSEGSNIGLSLTHAQKTALYCYAKKTASHNPEGQWGRGGWSATEMQAGGGRGPRASERHRVSEATETQAVFRCLAKWPGGTSRAQPSLTNKGRRVDARKEQCLPQPPSFHMNLGEPTT